MRENNPYTSLSEREVKRLKGKIFESVQKEQERRRHMKSCWAVAASFALIFTIGFYSQIDSEPSLEDFVKTSPKIDIEEAKGVALLLGNDARVDIDEKNSSINYSSSGQSVNIGSGKKITQKLKVKDNAIFNTIIVSYGERTNITLSDGTLVWLNSGSKLIYPVVFSGNERPVYLEGEGIFDVAHNPKKPFKVISEHQEIEVFGTVFNVTSYPGERTMETVLKSGSIKISYQSGKKKMKLSPGYLLSFNVNSAEIKNGKVNVDDYFSWRSGFLSLEISTLEEIMKKLSRSYNFKFIIQDEDIANMTLSGKLELKQDLQQVVEVLRETTKLNYKIKNNVILIN